MIHSGTVALITFTPFGTAATARPDFRDTLPATFGSADIQATQTAPGCRVVRARFGEQNMVWLSGM